MLRTRTFPLIVLAAATVLTAGGAEALAATPKKVPDAAHAPTATTPLSPAWEAAIDDTPAPFVTGAKVGFVVTTRSGHVTARSASGGDPLWEIKLGSPVVSPPVASGGGLVVITSGGDGSQSATVLDVATGGIVAVIPVGSSVPFMSAVEGGVVLADPSEGASSLSLVDPSDGSVRWKAPMKSVPSAPAAQCGDLILVGGADGALTAVAAADGSPRWSQHVGGAITTAPLCAGKRAWVGSADNALHALTLRRRGVHRRWSFLTGGDIGGDILMHGSRVLYTSFDTYLYALEADNGHLAWKVHLGRRPQSHAVLMGDLLMMAPLNTERLEVFHLPDGTQIAALALEVGKDRFVTPPSAAGEMIVVGAAKYGEETSRAIIFDPASIPPPKPAAPR